MSKSVRLMVSGVPLSVEYVANSDTHAEILRVWPDAGLDDIKELLASDVTNSIRVACVKQASQEADFLRRCQEQEAMEP